MLLPPERLSGLVVFTPRVFPDDRGFVLQSWVKDNLEQLGIPAHFEQAIQTQSHRGVVRGLHFQWAPPMAKLVRCLHGAVLDVVVDVRHGSPTLGDHAAVELTAKNHQIIWVPVGFAHGTFALEDDTTVLYECTAQHGLGGEGGILWNDPALSIAWPKIPPVVSEKDRITPTLANWLNDPRSQNFRINPT